MADDRYPSRRCILRTALLAGAVVPAFGLAATPARSALADLPEAEDGHAHDYVNDAEDAAGHEMYEPGQRCENCAFWTEEVREGWGGCAHPDFHDVLVNAEGWCSAYAPAA